MNDVKQIAQDQFGRNAEKYARSSVFAQGDSLDEMVRVTAPQPGWRALDIATGGGHCAFAFAPRVAQVVATDITPAMLEAAGRVARERGLVNVTFETADAESLPYPAASFDLVTCRIAPHHFGDPGQAVREMARVCKPGGLAAVIDGIVPAERAVADEINAWEIARDPSHVALLTVNGWSSLFCAAGLDAVHLNTFRMALDFDEHMHRAGCDPATSAALRRSLVGASSGMKDWLQPRFAGDRITFDWPLVLIVGRRHAGA